MYERIDNRRTVRKIYTEALIKRGDISLEDAEKAMEDFSARLSGALEDTRQTAPPKFTSVPPAPTERLLPDVPTAVADKALLDRIAAVVTAGPDGFHINPKLSKVFDARTKLYAEGQVDWSLGEAFAYGTLLAEGHDVRLAGQDSSRGTFGHRNAVLVDTETEEEIVPLNTLGLEAQGRFFVYDSLLSEYAALGFEYGYSVAAPDSLVLWEAQFGDFVNGAQIVIDQFISAAEDKWGQSSGLVLLLPHGYEGQGPEHSSGRIERFLELCANGNLQVVNLTSAAQLFHALRRQVKRAERKPLVVFATKSGLRASWSRSTIDEITTGSFLDVIDDPAPGVAPDAVRRVVLASGKVAFDAMKERDRRKAPVAVVRVEQLYPWPEDELADVFARYEHTEEIVWLQEEPENMGPWSFVHGRMHKLLREDFQLRHVARVASGSPAAGSQYLHELETIDLMARVFEGL
jgi:2-oxoglutarate dehydrogenase E1 component